MGLLVTVGSGITPLLRKYTACARLVTAVGTAI